MGPKRTRPWCLKKKTERDRGLRAGRHDRYNWIVSLLKKKTGSTCTCFFFFETRSICTCLFRSMHACIGRQTGFGGGPWAVSAAATRPPENGRRGRWAVSDRRSAAGGAALPELALRSDSRSRARDRILRFQLRSESLLTC